MRCFSLVQKSAHPFFCPLIYPSIQSTSLTWCSCSEGGRSPLPRSPWRISAVGWKLWWWSLPVWANSNQLKWIQAPGFHELGWLFETLSEYLKSSIMFSFNHLEHYINLESLNQNKLSVPGYSQWSERRLETWRSTQDVSLDVVCGWSRLRHQNGCYPALCEICIHHVPWRKK